jgi:hypothetical protein
MHGIDFSKKVDEFYVENVLEATGVLVLLLGTIDSMEDSSSNSLLSLTRTMPACGNHAGGLWDHSSLVLLPMNIVDSTVLKM